MKKLKKLIKRCFLLMVAVIILAGCVLAGSGYKMYRDALNHQSLERMEQSDHLEPAGRRQHNYAAACQKYVFHAGKEFHPKDCGSVYGVPAGKQLHKR